MLDTAPPPDPAANYRRFLVYGDDVGVASRYDGYRAHGTLWLPWERRGDLLRLLRELREAHDYDGTLAAALTRSDAEAFALAVIDEVFRRRWISYRCLVTGAGSEEPGGRLDLDLGAIALASVVVRRLRSLPGELAGREMRLRLARRVRPVEGDAKSARGRVDRELGARITFPQTFARSIRTARSGEALELLRLFSTLIADDWEKKVATLHRRRLSLRAAENLGWSDLAADTSPAEWKFNICYVRNLRVSEPPREPQRTVQLRLPLVD